MQAADKKAKHKDVVTLTNGQVRIRDEFDSLTRNARRNLIYGMQTVDLAEKTHHVCKAIGLLSVLEKTLVSYYLKENKDE